MSDNPDAIRAQIESTRADLSTNVNTLADTVNPVHAAKRELGKVKGAVTGIREKVMGSAADAKNKAAGSGSSAAASLSSAQSSVADAVTSAPEQIRSRTAGAPLAVGMIAFGVGWLAGSLLPASAAEQQAATKVKETATPVITDAAKEVGENLKEPAQQAVEAVKDTATNAAATVKDESTSAVSDLKDQAQDAKDTVQESRS
jgi:gas vesicle protein